jgi:hypothetical protein
MQWIWKNEMLQNKQHNYRIVVDEKHTNDHIWSFLGFLYNNRNRVGSTGRGGCSCNWRVGAWARVGAPVSEMTILPTSKAPPFSLQQILSNLGPQNILTSSSRSLEIIGCWITCRCGIENPYPTICGLSWDCGWAWWNTGTSIGVGTHVQL